MEIKTRDFGNICVEEDAVFDFPNGIFGFESSTQFAVFENKVEDISFLYLQSTKDLTPCFLVFEPWDMVPNYEPLFSLDDLEMLQVDDIEDLILLTTASIPDGCVENLSLNIKSPIALNPKTRKGFQIILQNQKYNVKFQPFLQHETPVSNSCNSDRKDGSKC